jgi:hypothetical protein
MIFAAVLSAAAVSVSSKFSDHMGD